MSTGAAARDVAYDVLRAVREDDAYANLLLPTRIDRARLGAADAGLATELTYGALRLRGYYDRVIALAAGRPVERIDPPLLDVLRLGAHQLLSMRIPAHAAVNESVALAARVAGTSKTGFVNAVLRAIERVPASEWRERVAAGSTDADDRLAALTSHPAWIIRALRQALALEGREAELGALLEADNAAPRVNLVALPGLVPGGELRKIGHPDRFSPYGFAPDDPFSLVARSNGTIRVQDEGSQLAALALVAARPIAPGERWLDLCAGPGGKAALLGAEAERGGATLLANELIPARVGLVERAVAPVKDTVTVVQADGRWYGADHPGEFDRILLDAPCTGLGALRRRPEARWRKQPRDVAELTRLQSELLESAVGALRPGGVVAYVTCSPHVGETRAVVADALKRHPELAELPTQQIVQDSAREPLDLAGPAAQVQLWPHRHGTDAMFIALLAKN